MADPILQFAATQGFLPHGYCFQWSPGLLSTMVASDAVIALSYFTIPVALLAFVRQRKDLQFNWIFVLFSAFIFLCGSTHVIDILVIWSPDYWLQAYAKAFTALASALTAVLLWPLIPRLVKIPSNAQLAALVGKLENEVAERRAAEARLAQLTQELEQRVAARTQQLEAATAERERLQDADRARDVAEQANRAKSQFLSKMSHELRTPLNAVLGFSQILMMPQAALAPRELAQVQHIDAAGRLLLSLVNDLLDIASIESGRMGLTQEPVNLADALNECKSMLRASAEAREVDLDLQAQADQPTVVSDGRRIRQVLSNLIGNAIKYNRPGGSVKATLTVRDSALHMEVADTGLGLSKAQKEQLFQPYNRLGRENDPRVEGTGLGLVVVKQLIDALHGTIEVQSEPDVGTRFHVMIPVH